MVGSPALEMFLAKISRKPTVGDALNCDSRAEYMRLYFIALMVLSNSVLDQKDVQRDPLWLIDKIGKPVALMPVLLRC